jgi:CNT family concentrative nucleoside transporter
MQAILGYAGLLALAWVLSENRRAVSARTVAAGLGLQVGLAVLLLALPAVREGFLALNTVVTVLSKATAAGTEFAFGWLGGGAPPFETRPGASTFILAFQALPLVLVISALSAILYHWRVLPAVVSAFAWALRRTLGLGGTAGVATAANVFVGMVEAPLLVKPYLARASRADLFVVMTAGMATIAGTMMVLYARFLQDVVPGAIGHLLTASVLNAPAAIVIARLLVPAAPDDAADDVRMEGLYASTMDAITTGTADGLRLLLNIVAMLIVLVALVALVNMILAALPAVAGAPLSLERLLGWIMSPVAWAIGIPWAEAGTAGQLLGTKVVVNEFFAFLQMGKMPPEVLSPESKLILTYGMCGFANFASLGIMLGGLSAMAPDRRVEIVGLGLKSILSGLMATLLTGALAGLLFRVFG